MTTVPSGSLGIITSTTSSEVRIGYENLFENATTVTASSEDSDFPVENAYDWRTYQQFKPAAAGTVNIDITLPSSDTADYFAFHGTDLSDNSGTIKLQYWDGAAYQDATSTLSPADNAPKMAFFDAKTSDMWRVVINSTPLSAIGQISFGEYMTFERGIHRGFAPPKLARSTRLINSVSEGGNFLGRSKISETMTTSVTVEFATDGWMRSTFLPFVKHAETKPFFMVWDNSRYPDEVAFCWVEGGVGAPSNTNAGQTKRLMSSSFNIRGYADVV